MDNFIKVLVEVNDLDRVDEEGSKSLGYHYIVPDAYLSVGRLNWHTLDALIKSFYSSANWEVRALSLSIAKSMTKGSMLGDIFVSTMNPWAPHYLNTQEVLNDY